MSVHINTARLEMALGAKVGADPGQMIAGSLVAEPGAGDNVRITWTSTAVIAIDQFKAILREAQS